VPSAVTLEAWLPTPKGVRKALPTALDHAPSCGFPGDRRSRCVMGTPVCWFALKAPGLSHVAAANVTSARVHGSAPALTHSHTHTDPQTPTHPHTHTDTHPPTHTYTHTCTHARTCTLTHTHTHTHKPNFGTSIPFLPLSSYCYCYTLYCSLSRASDCAAPVKHTQTMRSYHTHPPCIFLSASDSVQDGPCHRSSYDGGLIDHFPIGPRAVGSSQHVQGELVGG
jgi:hypothetical protein